MVELADTLDLGSSEVTRAGSSPVTRTIYAGMVELADTLDLGSSGVIRAGSSPVTSTRGSILDEEMVTAPGGFTISCVTNLLSVNDSSLLTLITNPTDKTRNCLESVLEIVVFHFGNKQTVGSTFAGVV